MSVLEWGKTGEHFYTTGVDKVAAYELLEVSGSDGAKTMAYTNGEAWDGVFEVSESPEGASKESLWAGNAKYLNLISKEEWKGGVSAYTCPPLIERMDGTLELVKGVKIKQQARKTFGMTWRSKIGNDVEGTDLGYVIHLAYGLSLGPSSRTYETESDDPNADELQWDLDSVPERGKFTTEAGKEVEFECSTMEIDSRDFQTEEKKAYLELLESKLYGSSSANAMMPMPHEVLGILNGQITE